MNGRNPAPARGSRGYSGNSLNTDTRHVAGLRELGLALRKLPQQMERNIMRGALRAGAIPIRDEVRRLAPKNTEDYAKKINIGTRVDRRGLIKAKIRPTGNHASLGHLLEFKVSHHVITPKKEGGWLRFGGIFAKRILHPGTAARPHFRPAFDSKAQAATEAAGVYIRRRFTRLGLEASDLLQDGDE